MAAIRGDGRFPRSTSIGSTPTQLSCRTDQQEQARPECCPYGYQLDLDFVKYAEEAAKVGVPQHSHDSLKLLKKPKKTTKEQLDEKGGGATQKSVYENVAALAPGRRMDEVRGEKAIKTSAVDRVAKLENQCLFSDSLENVMSDFEETLSRGGASKNKDHNSDYEMPKTSAMREKRVGSTATASNDFQRLPSSRAGVRKVDGYASDCGYAVPVGVASNRPSALRLMERPVVCSGGNNHYYASPNALSAVRPKMETATVEYASTETATGRPLPSSDLSDSMSSLSSPSSAQTTNGGGASAIQRKIEPSNSVIYESKFSNAPMRAWDASSHQSRTVPASPALLSPDFLASSSLPPKPALGLSGRVGLQIEQLASHLDSKRPASLDDQEKERRILDLERRIGSIPGPAIGGEKRRLQDELNRLIRDSKRIGYQRSITPIVLDTGENGYATALARAMSSVGTADDDQRHEPGILSNLPVPPPRRESVDRMKTSTSPSLTSYSTAPRLRTSSTSGSDSGNGSLNLNAFHSYRRTNPLSNFSSGSSAATIVRPFRSASAGAREEADSVSDSEYALSDRAFQRFGALRRSRQLLSRLQSALPPPPLEPQSRTGNEDYRQFQEQHTNGGQSHGVNAPNGHGCLPDAFQMQQKPLVRSVGVLTEQPKQIRTVSVSTCTAPLPQPKPCMECDGLRQRVLELSVKPFTFTRGTQMDECVCATCQRQSRLSTASFGCGTSLDDTRHCRVDIASSANFPSTCGECEKRSSVKKITFGVNTSKETGVHISTNTESVEVRNRHMNTEQQSVQSCATNTDQRSTKSVEVMVDKNVLLATGGYRTITSNTTSPFMVTFGVNTEPTAGEIDCGKYAESTRNGVGDQKMRQTHLQSVESQDVATATDDAYFGLRSSVKENHAVERRNVAIGTEASSKVVRMVDKFVDSTVRTRDVGTRTPPPPPPPLQFLRSSSSQTVNESRTMVSVGSGDCTLLLKECDSCNGVKPSIVALDQQESTPYRIEAQSGRVELERGKVEAFNGADLDFSGSAINNPKPLQTDSLIDSKMERKLRGIQRVFSPKNEQSALDPEMWKSQNSVTSDPSSDHGVNLAEESIVVCPLDDDEEGKNEETGTGGNGGEPTAETQSSPGKFDFTKPRQTRAFALSKAAAARKLLTSDTSQGQTSSSSFNNTKSSQPAAMAFRRTSIQSKSVRLDSKKGDSLAYITDKKQFQQGQAPNGATKPTTTQTSPSTGLKGKVVIKKNPIVRKATPAAGGPRVSAAPNRFKPKPLPYQRRTSSLSATQTTSPSVSSIPKDEESAAEAEDVVGPLPSEVAAKRSGAPETACYTNLAVENGDDDVGSQSKINLGRKKLVGDVVENLPAKVERVGDVRKSSDDGSSEDSDSSAAGDEDSDESLEEGSYDTNGNISSTCDVGNGDTTIAQDGNGGDGSVNVSQKFEMSQQLIDACSTLTTHLTAGKGSDGDEQTEWAQKFLQHEWLKTSSSKRANPTHVADFLDELEEFSPQLLSYVVNLCDQNENTALHYAVSRGHFDIVSLLLDTKMCNLNKPNKAGYTPVMLASLCPVASDTDSMVIQRLFQMGDVNIKASQHGQTALMLAVSHGNLETTKLLLESGAGVNIQDEEGSTALMCAAEHGHKEIVRLLLAHSEIDASMIDNDRSTALSIAVENDHKDIGVLIYAHLNYGRSPPSLQSKSTPVWC